MPSAPADHFSNRVLCYLERAEASEENPHHQCDMRIAWITVRLADRGHPAPHVEASIRVLGLHPEKVWPSLVARRRAQLGPHYEEFWGVDFPPKKPAQSVGTARGEPRKTIAA